MIAARMACVEHRFLRRAAALAPHLGAHIGLRRGLEGHYAVLNNSGAKGAGLRYAARTVASTWLRGGEIRGLRAVNLPLKSRLLGIARALALIALIALLAALLQPEPEIISGRATATDGDSLRVGGERIRLVGVDAPEYDQICGDRDGANWRCGEAARLLLAGQVGRGDTQCLTAGRDRYGRILAHCRTAEGDLGQILVSAGLAVAEGEYVLAELSARASGSGIWAGSFDLPLDWRQTHVRTRGRPTARAARGAPPQPASSPRTAPSAAAGTPSSRTANHAVEG